MVGKLDIPFAAMLCLYSRNIASEVEDALASAFNDQTLPPSQLIVVFDGPTSNVVVDVIDRFSLHHDVIKIFFQDCRGHGFARAAAVEACKYDFIAIIDADDISMPHRFEALLNVLVRYPQAAVVGGGVVEFEIRNGLKIPGETIVYPVAAEDVRRYLSYRSPISQPTAILRVAAVRAVGNYQHWFNNEDYHLWIRLVVAGYHLLNVGEPVLWYRTDPNLFIRRGGFKYWWSEVRLQYFSYKNGVTNFKTFMLGLVIRLIIQVLMPAKLRALFYRKVLRRI